MASCGDPGEPVIVPLNHPPVRAAALKVSTSLWSVLEQNVVLEHHAVSVPLPTPTVWVWVAPPICIRLDADTVERHIDDGRRPTESGREHLLKIAHALVQYLGERQNYTGDAKPVPGVVSRCCGG